MPSCFSRDSVADDYMDILKNGRQFLVEEWCTVQDSITTELFVYKLINHRFVLYALNRVCALYHATARSFMHFVLYALWKY